MDEEEFFHSLGLQTAASERASTTNNTSKQMSTPPQSHVFDGGGGEGGGVGDAPAAYDSIWTNVSGGVTNSNSEMSFIDAIGRRGKIEVLLKKTSIVIIINGAASAGWILVLA